MTQDHKQEKRLEYAQRSMRKYNPYKLLLSFALIGIGTLFLVLMISFMVSKSGGNWSPIAFPKAFIVSTVLILISSVTIQQARHAFRKEHHRPYMWYMIATGGLGLAFMISQFFGWHTLQTNGIGIHTDNGASYLYLISGMHALHVLAGLIALGVFCFFVVKYNWHLGTSIYYLTDPVRKLHLDLVSMYWHFLGGVWILLVVFFLLQSIGV